MTAEERAIEALEAAQAYVQRGWSVIPIPLRQKAPQVKDWPNLRLTELDVPRQFREAANVGLILGAPSGDLADIDLDSPEALAVADFFLPQTMSVFDRASKPRAHRLYYCASLPSPRKFSAPDGKCLVELRSTGQQTVVPPSVHPSGEVITWVSDGEPARVEGPILLQNGARTAAAALLGRSWPAKGQRHDAALALAGMLFGAGWAEDEAQNFVRAVVTAAGDEEARARVLDVVSTSRRVASGKAATGVPRLALIVGDEVIRRVRNWLDLDLRSGTTEEPERTRRNWPEPPEDAAFYGLAGDVVRIIEPHTESSTAALLIQVLVCFGNMIGRTAHFVAEGSQHFLNLFTVLVGVTSGGRKGSSWAQVLRLLRHVDSRWVDEQLQSGLSTGEGLIAAVRDPIIKHEPVREKGRVVGYQDVETDPGVADKRLLVFESEFASPLRMMARDGNILSGVIRQAWDTGVLRTLTKNSPTKATDAHISIIGHITRDEVRREMSSTDMANGFANRILWACTSRSKELPEGGNLSDAELSPVATRLREAMVFARQVGEMKRDDAVKAMWQRIYHEVTASNPGLLGAVVSRAAPQIMRLACLYSLLDHSDVVREEHLLAAVALWEYCLYSAQFIFGDGLGDTTADAILLALRNAANGMDRTQISSLFARHKRAEEISRALAVLQEHGLAKMQLSVCDGTGRPSEVWFSISSNAKEAK
jgi:hypothetical protein